MEIKIGSIWLENARSVTAAGNLRAKPRKVRVLSTFVSGETGRPRVRFCIATSDGQRPHDCGAEWFKEHFTFQREAANGQA